MLGKFVDKEHTTSHEIGQLTKELRELEEVSLKSNFNQEYEELEGRFQRLVGEKDMVEDDLKMLEMDQKEGVSYIMDRMKRDKARNSELDRELETIRRTVNSLKRTIQDRKRDSESSTTAGKSNESQKFEKLLKRDEEMTSFIDGFDPSKNEIIHVLNY